MKNSGLFLQRSAIAKYASHDAVVAVIVAVIHAAAAAAAAAAAHQPRAAVKLIDFGVVLKGSGGL